MKMLCCYVRQSSFLAQDLRFANIISEDASRQAMPWDARRRAVDTFATGHLFVTHINPVFLRLPRQFKSFSSLR